MSRSGSYFRFQIIIEVFIFIFLPAVFEFTCKGFVKVKGKQKGISTVVYLLYS